MLYKIVRYSREFKDQVLRLQRPHWGPDDKRNAAYFDWKFEQNPYFERPLIYLAFDGNELIGMRGMFGTKWVQGSASSGVVVPCSCDTIIAAAHRKYGVLGKITEFMLEDLAKQGYPCVAITSAGQATHIQALMTGWRCIGGFEEYSRAASRPGGSKSIRRYLSKRPKLAAAVKRLVVAPRQSLLGDESKASNILFRTIARDGRRVGTKTGDFIAVEQMARPAEMAELVARCSDGERIRHVRDKRYFAWRYRNPKKSYCFLYLENRKLDGFMVLQAGITPSPSDANIVDWEATNRGARQAFLDAALKLGRSIGFTTWAVSLSDEDKALLRDAAFRPRADSGNLARTGPGFLVRRVGGTNLAADPVLNDQAFLDIGSWDLRMIDSDHL